MAERSQAHVQDMERKAMDATKQKTLLSQIFGFTIALSGLAASVTFGFLGMPWPATVVGSTTVISLVSVFLIGRSRK